MKIGGESAEGADGPKLVLVKRTQRVSNTDGVLNVSGLLNLKVYKGNKRRKIYDNTSRDVRKTL